MNLLLLSFPTSRDSPGSDDVKRLKDCTPAIAACSKQKLELTSQE
jgi:hypothetical protein